jgi:hypothetical protein
VASVIDVDAGVAARLTLLAIGGKGRGDDNEQGEKSEGKTLHYVLLEFILLFLSCKSSTNAKGDS